MTKDILWRSLEVTPTHKIFDGKCVVVYVQKPYFFFYVGQHYVFPN